MKQLFRCVIILLGLNSSILWAESIAIIGTGSVSSALGKNLTGLGHQSGYASRNPGRDSVQDLVRATGNGAQAKALSEAAMGAEIVVLAIPWNVVGETVLQLGDLSGKIIIDPTNLRSIDEGGLTMSPEGPSNDELIANLAPTASVAKGFNVMGSFLMEKPDLFGFKYSMPIAGQNKAVNRP